MLYWGMLMVGAGEATWFAANMWEEWNERHRPAVLSLSALAITPGLTLVVYALTHG